MGNFEFDEICSPGSKTPKMTICQNPKMMTFNDTDCDKERAYSGKIIIDRMGLRPVVGLRMSKSFPPGYNSFLHQVCTSSMYKLVELYADFVHTTSFN